VFKQSQQSRKWGPKCCKSDHNWRIKNLYMNARKKNYCMNSMVNIRV
jgi:hypothetical protein